MATYLVTGGCGFIGSHLCEALVRDGSTVRVLDDLSSGSPANLPAEVEVVQSDVADSAAVTAAMSGVDGCFHLAAVASVERSREDWLGAHRTNLTGTLTVLDAARLAARRRPVPVVYASSAAVYGNCVTLPIREDVEKHPRSAYAADKYGSELHAQIAAELYGVPAVGLRFFNVYGPRQDPRSPYSGVISIFCDRLRRGQPIEIFGDGSQTRDFVFVEDVVAALVAAMRQRPTAPPVFNICSGRQTSVRQLAETIGWLCGCRPQIVHRPSRLGDVVHSLGDCSAARQVLGIPPTTDLRRGLAATLSWIESLARATTPHRAAPAGEQAERPLAAV